MTTDYRLKAAKEAAAKVNAMLVATGQLRPSDLNKGRSKPGKSSDLFVEEVVINDAPMSARNFLTRSFTQEEISKMSGASVSTRGRYMTQEEIDNNTSNDRPLYLHIQGVNQQDVKVAVGRIMHLIMEHTHRKGNSHHHKGKGHRASSGQNAGGGSRQGDRSPRMDKTSAESIEPITENKIFPQNILREKVFLPSTVNLNPVEIRVRLAGENNSNTKYIQDETGATIFMRGIGSGFIEPSTGMESQEALHFYLEHQNQDQFNQAKDLVVNLAQTILSQIHQEQPQEHIPSHPPPNAIPQQGFQQNHLGQIPLNGGNVIPPPLTSMPPQIQAGNQTVVPTLTQQMPPGMFPTQLGVQVNPVQLPQTPQLLIPTQVPAPNTIPTQSIQELQQASVAHGTQLLQISVPSSVGGPSLVSQQLVQTSAGPQLVHLPHGTQIVSTLDGPRLVSLTPVSSASTAFITQSVQSNALADQQPLSVAISQTVPHPMPQPVPQPVPHPLPQNVSGFGQGETYVFDSEQRKFPSSPVIMTSASNTFAFIPQEPLQQTVVPTTTMPVEISQSQWHPPANSVVLSHVCNTPAVADVTFAQTPHTQATFVRPPNMSHTSENFPCGDISNHPLTDPMRPSSEWNIDIGAKPTASHYLETTASTSGDPSLSKDREDSSLISDPNRHVTDQRSPLKTSHYMWAQYPNVSYGSVHCAPHDKPTQEGTNNQTYTLIDGGSQQNEKEPKNNSSSSETFVKDDALQGTRHVLRNSPSAGGFSGEPKRRRSFKPKGDFHGPNRIMKREHDKSFPNRPAQVPLNEQFYNDDVNLRTSFDYSPSTSKMSAYPRSMRREDFHMRNRSEIGPYYGDPNAEKMRNPWIWNRNDRNIDPVAGPSQSSNYNHRSKAYDSPWESGIPGVQIGKEMPRPNEPLVNRNKFPKKKFNRLY